MEHIALLVSYDGSFYHGFQRQINGITIQEILEDTITNVTQNRTIINFAGRTDAGVHACGQVVDFYTDSNIPANKFSNALNSLLPEDIRILESVEVEDTFNSRFLAIKKQYRYIISNTQIQNVFMRKYAWNIKQNLDLDEIIGCSKLFIGKHDFSGFAAAHRSTKTNERTIYSLDVKRKNDFIIFTICGNGFLYNMVRIITGTLVEAGLKKLNKQDIMEILKYGDRSKAGRTAPAHGLCLEKVIYEKDVFCFYDDRYLHPLDFDL